MSDMTLKDFIELTGGFDKSETERLKKENDWLKACLKGHQESTMRINKERREALDSAGMYLALNAAISTERDQYRNERDALKAKLDAMEKQEPCRTDLMKPCPFCPAGAYYICGHLKLAAPKALEPLTDEQRDAIVRQAEENDWHDYNVIDAVEAAHGIGSHPAAPKAQESLTADDVQWVVNDNAELGVKIGEQFFFLYKGESIVYEDAKHDDDTPMKWRLVGKREFGECCHPIKFYAPDARMPKRYTDELAFVPGLSFGKPEDAAWRELPPAHGIGGERKDLTEQEA